MAQFCKREEIRILLQGQKHTANQIATTLGVGRQISQRRDKFARQERRWKAC